MQYGRPKIFAIESIFVRLWFQLKHDFGAAYEFHREAVPEVAQFAALFTMVLGTLLSFGLVANTRDTGSDVFGHYAVFEEYQGQVVRQFGAPPTLTVAKATGLSEGHRCLERQIVLPGNGGRCISKNGISLLDRVDVKNSWKVTCCTRVSPRSDSEPLSLVRRFFLFVGMPLNGGILSALVAVVFVSLLTSVGVAIGVAMLTPVTALLLFGRTLGLNAAAVARFFTTVYLAGRRLRVRPWPETKVNNPLIVQMTDLHMSQTPYELKVDPLGTVAPIPSGKDMQNKLIELLQATVALSPSAIALTGDITDSGLGHEWDQFTSTWQRFYPSTTSLNVAMAPGNHDVSFNHAETPDLARATKKKKENRFLAAEMTVTGRVDNKLGVGAYPILSHIESNGVRINILTLNSCRYDSRYILSNAVGKLGRDQLGSLRATLAQITGPLVILMHHHIALEKGRLSLFRPGPSVQELMKLPLDGRELVSLLTTYSKKHPVLVLHGHQHENLRFIVEGKTGGHIHVFGLASSTLGCATFLKTRKRHVLDGRLYLGLIDFCPNEGWRAEARVLP